MEKPTPEQIMIVNQSMKEPLPLDYHKWTAMDHGRFEAMTEFAIIAIKRLAEAFKDYEGEEDATID